MMNLKALIAPVIRNLATRNGEVTLRLRRGVREFSQSEMPLEETENAGIGGVFRLSEGGNEYEEHRLRALVQPVRAVTLEQHHVGIESGLYQVRIIDGERDHHGHVYGGPLSSSSRDRFLLYADDEVECDLGGERVVLVVRGTSNHAHQGGYYTYECVLRGRG